MKRFMSVGLCALLSISPSCIFAGDASNAVKEARDSKINNILTGVGKVIEGLVKIITEIKIKDGQNKQTLSADVKKIAAILVHDIASSLPHDELSLEDVESLRTLLHEAHEALHPMLTDHLAARCLEVHIMLHNAEISELEAARQQEADVQLNQPDVETEQEGAEKEFYTNLIGALHNLVQNLFTIIESPENPKVMGQSIADMFSNIINVASQTLKYEYLSSRDAEEKVAIYLDSFSKELTKEIKQLMLQTALNLRDESFRKHCCGSSCNSCCNSCSRICKPSCNSCSSCCRTLEDANQDETTRACCSSCSCPTSGSCSSCGSCCRKQDIDTVVDITRSTDFAQRHNKHRRSRACCNNCGCTTGNCGCRADTSQEVTETTDEQDDTTKCGCNKPKKSEATEAEQNDAIKCGCNKPKRTEAEQESETSKCGCHKPKISKTVKAQKSSETKQVAQVRQKRLRRR